MHDATDLYETDFYAWTQKQVSLLRTQQWSQLDTVNLIEEIEALGRKERQKLRTGSIIAIAKVVRTLSPRPVPLHLADTQTEPDACERGK